MFNNSNGYSLADIAAATGGNNRNDGMWDNGAWWIIILFLFCFNGGMWGQWLRSWFWRPRCWLSCVPGNYNS